MKTSNLIESPPQVTAKSPDQIPSSTIKTPHVEPDHSGWTTGIPEDQGATPPLLLTALRAAMALAVIGLAYILVRYFSAR